MREIFHLARAWSTRDNPQEQVYQQNLAEEEFDRLCYQAKLLGLLASPIKRTMQTIKDEDGRDRLFCYYQRAYVEGMEQDVQRLKDIMNKKSPSVFAQLLSEKESHTTS